MARNVQHFFDPDTSTLTYVVFDEETKDAVIIDPVLNYDPKASKFSYESVEEVRQFVKEHNLQVRYIMDTHAHADHLSGAQALKKIYPDAPYGIRDTIKLVQGEFKGIFNIKYLNTDGAQFDTLFKEGDEIAAGSITIKVLATPGHTPADSSYLIDDMVFTGDALFMPDSGTGRCDFPKGSAADQYESIYNVLFKLPDDTKVYVGHDYQPDGRDLKFRSTIGEQKTSNILITAETTKEDFIKIREGRDEGKAAPRLLLQSIQVNVDAGNFPPVEDNDVSYLKMPLREKK